MAEIHSKHVDQLRDLNKLNSVASCWIIIAMKNKYLSGLFGRYFVGTM